MERAAEVCDDMGLGIECEKVGGLIRSRLTRAV